MAILITNGQTKKPYKSKGKVEGKVLTELTGLKKVGNEME